MSEKLSLERDFTRFFDDPTFPHKVTVCVGDKRMMCSGALLAQQSSVLERKFREDSGVLMFEELLDLNNKNHVGIIECLCYLHGADLQLSLDTLPIVLKFSSTYQVEELFTQALNWLKNYLDDSNSVEIALNFLKVSKSLNVKHSAKIKSLISSFIRCNKELFRRQCANHLDTEMSGQDLMLIIGEHPDISGDILRKWVSLSVENANYIVEKHSNFDFNKAFPDSEQFSTFIATLSSKAESANMFRNLLELQKTFFESQKKLMRQNLHGSGSMTALGNLKIFPSSSDSQNIDANGNKSTPYLKLINNTNTYTPLLVSNHKPLYISDTEEYSSSEDFDGVYGSSVHSSEEDGYYNPSTDEYARYPDDDFDNDEYSWSNHDYDSSSDQYNLQYDSDESSVEEFTDTQLYIGNLPPNAKATMIKRMFCGYGKITDITIASKKRRKNFGFISFESSTSAYNLLRRSQTRNYEMNGYTLAINVVHRKN